MSCFERMCTSLDRAKIDLIMWTFNSGRTLERSLESIERAIPQNRICHRIMVDGGSRDNTLEVGARFGWQIFRSLSGISRQANFALNKVDSELYASFEHDVLLAENWLPIVEEAIARENVAVAQGIRLFTGSGTLAAMDRWNYEHRTMSTPYASLDNNLCKTEVIRKAGGYAPPSGPAGTDSQLLAAVHRLGYEWVIDRRSVSGHMRPGISSYAKHILGGQQRAMMEYEKESGPRPIARLLFSPFRGAQMAAKYHASTAFAGYPIYRFLVFVVAKRVASQHL
jgi:glycosyl transferase family 2